MSDHDSSKRQFIKAAAYVAPVVLTLNATPSLATIGSFADGGIGNGASSLLGNGGAPLARGRRHRRNRLLGLHRRRHKKHNV